MAKKTKKTAKTQKVARVPQVTGTVSSPAIASFVVNVHPIPGCQIGQTAAATLEARANGQVIDISNIVATIDEVKIGRKRYHVELARPSAGPAPILAPAAPIPVRLTRTT